jgi:tetratricopeptide (TPR) repeat protein
MNCSNQCRYPGEPVYFLGASSKETLEADLQALVQSQSDVYTDALLWLGSTTRDWLIIMDNADDPSLELSPFLPRCSHGHVIITTRDRHREVLAPASTYAVDGLPLDESITLLLNTSQYEDNVANRELSEEIAQELGCLPLALAHAGSYIRLRKCLNTYLETYRESSSQLLKRKFDMPQGYRHSVARTIEMSFEKLSRQAQDLLTLLSHLDARSIPHSIIEKAATRRFRHVAQEVETEYSNILSGLLCPSGDWSSIEFDNLIEDCEKYSLVQFSTQGEHKFYSMHVLVQGFIQVNYQEVQGHSSRRLIARLLGSAITKGYRYEYLAFNRLLSPHLRLVDPDDIIEAGDHYGYGKVLEEAGEGRLAVSHMECCVQMWGRSHGDDSEITLDAMVILAISYSTAGREEDALQLRERLMKTQRRRLGEDHPDTLRAMNNLALSYSKLGRDREALPLQEQVLEKRRRLLGEDHLDTLITMNNLASLYSNLGRDEEALSLKEQVLEKWKRQLGEDHVDTLMAMNNLAVSYSKLGRDEEALPLQEQVLEKRRRLLGEDHLDTLMAMSNLALSYSNLGRDETALPLEEQVLEKRRRLLGEDHLNTLSAMGNLAISYSNLGRHEEALKFDEAVVERRRILFGEDHLETIDATFNLAISYSNLRRYEKALQLQKEVVKRRKRLLGEYHHNTLDAMQNLAWIHAALGRKDEASNLRAIISNKCSKLPT